MIYRAYYGHFKHGDHSAYELEYSSLNLPPKNFFARRVASASGGCELSDERSSGRILEIN